MPLSYTTDSFIAKAQTVHGDKYDYSKALYTGWFNPISIICKIHGEFKQTPKAHLGKRGCKKCWINKATITKEAFLSRSKELHQNKYDYSLSNYVNYTTKLEIICPIHGIFKQTPAAHISGNGCKKCALELTAKIKRCSSTEFIEKSKKIFKNKYIYTKTKYLKYKSPIIITCLIHGDFIKTYSSHIVNKQGCPKCKTSKGETIIENWLMDNDITNIVQAMFNDCRGLGKRKLRFDFYLPEFNTCIEFDGPQHKDKKFYIWKNSEYQFQKLIMHDKIKDEFCKNKGMQLIRIAYNQKNKISEILNAALLKNIKKVS